MDTMPRLQTERRFVENQSIPRPAYKVPNGREEALRMGYQ